MKNNIMNVILSVVLIIMSGVMLYVGLKYLQGDAGVLVIIGSGLAFGFGIEGLSPSEAEEEAE